MSVPELIGLIRDATRFPSSVLRRISIGNSVVRSLRCLSKMIVNVVGWRYPNIAPMDMFIFPYMYQGIAEVQDGTMILEIRLFGVLNSFKAVRFTSFRAATTASVPEIRREISLIGGT